jgi:hypothetical protein
MSIPVHVDKHERTTRSNNPVTRPPASKSMTIAAHVVVWSIVAAISVLAVGGVAVGIRLIFG